MGNQILGYACSILGVALVASGLSQFNASVVKLVPQVASVPALVLQIGGGVLVLLGVYFLMGKGGGKAKALAEVPIYKGNQIVGYRRQN